MAHGNSAIIQEFLLESFEGLASISDELTSYEKNPNDKELLNSIFRKVHTLKGSSSFLGLKQLQGITHAAESVLDLIRDGVVALNAEMIDVLLECFDCCLELLRHVENTGKENSKDYGSLIGKFSSVLEKNTSSSVGIKGQGVKIHKELLIHELTEKDKKQEGLKLMEKKEVKIVANDVSPSPSPIPTLTQTPTLSISPTPVPTVAAGNDHDSSGDGSSAKSASLTDSVVRVNVQLLDKIMNVVGELVLNRNQILQYANVMNASDLNRLAQQLNIITTELQTDIMTTRMQPVGSVLTKFERIVRDLARSQNKKIKLEIFGKDTELDKTLLEAIRDPLTHLIRNSVDHGVELPEKRKNKGKDEEGKIIIKSYHEGGQVTIEISDDGNGIDPQRILEKAVQKGIVTPEQAPKMSARQILNIIFMPGFSTAEQVTNISGRGVGMDVVKSNIEKIGGSVDVVSNVGEGTTFKLKIPLTLAIVPALVVQSQGETYAIPQINLVELVRLEGEEGKSQLEIVHDSEFFRLRGNLIPVFRLGDSLKLKKINELKQDDDFVSVVILNAEGRVYGLIVDAILDTEEIVVKPLSKKLKNLLFFAGVTIMGDGRVALIIDTIGFLNTVDRGHGQKGEQLLTEEQEVKTHHVEEQEFLLCSLGDKRSYAIPLMFVSRLEEFKSADVEWSGDQALIKYGHAPLPLVNLENTLKLKGQSVLEIIKENEDSIVACVVVKIRDHLFGLVVDVIRDIAVSEGGINSESVDRNGILGTIFVADKTISILDIHSIVDMQKLEKKEPRRKVSGNHGRILIIEDSPLYRKVMKDFLEENGYEVATAVNGEEGIDFLDRGEEVDLIILDIEMPVMNGWDFSKEIRASQKKYSQIPIIAVSANVSKKDKEKGVTAGFNQHLEKLDKEEVLKAVGNYTNH